MGAITNAIVISDTHCGDQLGLCPPKIQLAHGPIVHHSRFQAIVWKCWEHFWNKWVPMVTRGEDYCIILNGDIVEGRHHGSTHQMSQNKADQANIAYECLAPIVDKCKGGVYYISGTPAHAGEAGEDEEQLARRLGAVVDPDTKGYSRYELFIRIGNALVHVSHHIGVTGSMAYETTALTKEFQEFCAESARWGQPIPDIIVRSHRHRHAEVRVPSVNGYGIIFVTPAWQLKTPFLFRVPGGRVTTPMIGGSLIRQGDEEAYTRHKVWKTKRSTTAKPMIEE